jgi:hypothetical protein
MRAKCSPYAVVLNLIFHYYYRSNNMNPTGSSKASAVDAIVQNQLKREDARNVLGSKLA